MIFPDIKRNDIWQVWHNILPEIFIDWKIVNIKNFRDLDYNVDVENYRDISFDINNIKKINFISVPFWVFNSLSHIILEFEIEWSENIFLSVEARRKPWEWFSTLKWLYKWYGLIYIWGSERDIVWTRRDKRKKHIIKYSFDFSQKFCVEWFKFFANKTNDLIDNPKYYNTLFSNCTTNLWDAFELMWDKKPSKNFSFYFTWYIHNHLKNKWLFE